MVKSKGNIFSIISIILILVSSCSNVVTNSDGATSTAESTQLPTQNPTSIPTQIPAATAITIPDLIYQCLEVVPDLPKDAQPQGLLVLDNVHPFLLNLETGVKKSLRDGQGEFRASSDGRWLASRYVDDSQEIWLLVETADGIQQEPILWNDDWFLLGGWLDNERVWVSHRTEPLVAVVNPFTGEQQELAPDFPGFETAAQAGEHFALGASPVLYSSSLRYAIYPRLENDGYVYVVLWDRQANRVLAKAKDIFKSFEYDPVWSLDQKEIYVAVGDKWDSHKPNDAIEDFFSLNQNGQVRQLTNFEALFTETYIVGVSLSPDGKKIAFWLHAQPSPYEEQQLAVLDLETQQVINYCIPGLHHGNTPSPVWSPAIWSLDSRYLAVQDQYEPNAGRTILVDTHQGWAAQVAELIPTGWPAGWMASP